MPPILLLALAVGCEKRDLGTDRRLSPPIARVDGTTLRASEFESLLPANHSDVLTAEERRAYLDRWITTELLYAQAVKEGMGTSPEIEARLNQYKKDIIADQLVQKVIRERAVVSDAECRAYYNAREYEYTHEVRVSHILVDTPEDVEKVREALKTRTFSWVERRYSLDKHTGPGGDLGYLSKGNMTPEFENVVFKMNVGDISEPVETEFGYHFIKLTDVREAREKMTYEDMADEISRILLLEKHTAVYDSLIAAVRVNADVEILDNELRYADEEAVDIEPDSTSQPE